MKSTMSFKRVGVSERDSKLPPEALDRAARRLEELFGDVVLPLEDHISRAVRRHLPDVQEKVGSLPDRLRLLRLPGEERSRTILANVTEFRPWPIPDAGTARTTSARRLNAILHSPRNAGTRTRSATATSLGSRDRLHRWETTLGTRRSSSGNPCPAVDVDALPDVATLVSYSNRTHMDTIFYPFLWATGRRGLHVHNGFIYYTR